MSEYNRKIINSLEPEWYRNSSKSERKEIQDTMRKNHDDEWLNKPASIPSGTMIVAKESTKNITKGRMYKVFGHFCTLVTTIYYSQWHQFVTLKNNDGWTVKMNFRHFELANLDKTKDSDKIKILEYNQKVLFRELGRKANRRY